MAFEFSKNVERATQAAVATVKWAGIIGGLASGVIAILKGDIATGAALIASAFTAS